MYSENPPEPIQSEPLPEDGLENAIDEFLYEEKNILFFDWEERKRMNELIRHEPKHKR